MLDPALLVGAFPEFNADNTPFTKANFHKVIKETRPAGTAIAQSLDLAGFQIGYDENNHRMAMP